MAQVFRRILRILNASAFLLFSIFGLPLVATPSVSASSDSTIVFSDGNGPYGGAGNIQAMHSDGTGRTVIGKGHQPQLSQDGSKVAYYGDSPVSSCSNDGGQDIYVMNSDGSNVQDLTSYLDQSDCAPRETPSWSPDAKKLAFYTDNLNAIFVMNADGSNVAELHAGLFPSWSPDGTKIAFNDNSNSGHLSVMNADG
jgi:hypothetical protein